MISAFRILLLSFFFIISFQSQLLAQAPTGANGGGSNGGSTGGWWQGVDTEEFADGEIRDAYCDIIDLMEGNLGGMLMSIAGILAFATAALGDFKHGITAIVVGISSFAIAALTSLYFGELCGGDNGGANARINNLNRIVQIDLTNSTQGNTTENLDPFDF